MFERIDDLAQRIQTRNPYFYDFLVALTLPLLSVCLVLLHSFYFVQAFVFRPAATVTKKTLLFSSTSTSSGSQLKDHILITGASSGIGSALAREYAKPGTKLSLISRSTKKLKELKQELNRTGAQVEIYSVDVTDIRSLEETLKSIDDDHEVSTLIVNAGISKATLKDGEDDDFMSSVRPIVQTNYVGALATIQCILDRMIKRHAGKIVVISSLAGIVGVPTDPAYSSTKHGLSSFVTLLQPSVKKFGVSMHLVSPGLVDTPMSAKVQTRMTGISRPTVVSARMAAKYIKDGVDNDNEMIVFPFSTYIMLKILSYFPQAFINRVLSLVPLEDGEMDFN
ncbi:hypothetical protein MP638_004033 [Amoeboaphelidium occidentale]|nr:hypothetical protein MP638_004033 [Amoeboaphelidium occidentale]